MKLKRHEIYHICLFLLCPYLYVIAYITRYIYGISYAVVIKCYIKLTTADKSELINKYHREYFYLIRSKKYLRQPYNYICKKWLSDILKLQLKNITSNSAELYIYKADFYTQECINYVNFNYSSYNRNNFKQNDNFYLYIYNLAMDSYSKAIEIEPNNADFYMKRAQSYCLIDFDKFYKEVINDYKCAIQLNPKNIEYYRFGITKLGLYDNYSKIIEIEPLNIEHYENSAKYYISKNDFNSAIADYSKAIEIEPDNHELKQLRTQCYLDSLFKEVGNSNFALLIEKLGNLITIDPYGETKYRKLRTQCYLDSIFKEVGDSNFALLIEKLDNLITIDPYGKTTYRMLIIKYRLCDICKKIDNQDYDNALIELTRLIDLAPDKPKYYGYRADFYYYRGYTYFLKKTYNNAIKDFTNCIKLGITHIKISEVYILLGNCYKNKNELKKAEVNFTKATSRKLNKNNFTSISNAYLERAKFYHSQNLLEKAIADYEKSLDFNSKNGETYYERGLAFLDLNEQAKARDDFQNAIELLPENSKYRQKCLAMLRKTTPIYTEEYWWNLDGWQFEEEVAKVFMRRGYQADVTKGSGDGGVDIILKKNGRISIVQCKHHKHPVPPEPIRALYGCKPDFKADEVIRIASSGVTEGGIKFIENKPDFQIFELKDIIEMVKNSDVINIDISDDKVDIGTCTKEELLRLNCFDEVKAGLLLNARKQGKIYYDIDTLATDLNLQPHELLELQDKLIFPAKPKSKLGRRIEI